VDNQPIENTIPNQPVGATASGGIPYMVYKIPAFRDLKNGNVCYKPQWGFCVE